MSTAIEIALMLVGLFAIGWAIVGPRGNTVTRLILFALGIAAVIVARALYRGGQQ